MDREAEVIHQQMTETRESLADKIETLEKQVAGTIESVTGTVEAVGETVEQVKEAVQGTVETVKEKVEGTVETVKETLDIGAHVRRHPWVGFGASLTASNCSASRRCSASSSSRFLLPYSIISSSASRFRSRLMWQYRFSIEGDT